MVQIWWLKKIFFMQINLHDSRMVTHKKKSLHMKRAMWCAGLYEFSYLVFFVWYINEYLRLLESSLLDKSILL